ncbi:hypothetical protein B0H10DRAFT_638414 [Mycena sp. CBHHK59/15]|nr:hypothetical protein B0H10DRAFT_638414 [Mycena sp. CBHHK59/15]
MTIARDVQLSRSLFLSGIVILFYDHILTLGEELRHIWATRHTYSSAWFLFIRYFSFCGNIVMALDTFGDFEIKMQQTEDYPRIPRLGSGDHCRTLCLRVYAMYGLSKKVFGLMMFVGTITVALSAWSVVPVGTVPIISTPAPGCYVPQSRAQDLRMTGAWGAELVGDVILIALTLHRGYSHGRDAASIPGSLWGVLIRDGIAYFLMICLVNLANILMFYFGDLYTSSSLSWFTSAISVAMILRLMLNLHVAAAQDTTTAATTELDPIHFTSRIATPHSTFDT